MFLDKTVFNNWINQDAQKARACSSNIFTDKTRNKTMSPETIMTVAQR